MANITLTTGQSFSCNPNETILDAAMRSQVTLSYSCRNGRCGVCQCKVIEGQSRFVSEEVGLSTEQREAGVILSCARVALTDLKLEVPDFGGVLLPERKTLPCRIVSLNRLSEDVVHVFLRLPPTARFSYIAGQHVEIVGPSGARRSYSLASAPRADKLLDLHVRNVPGGELSAYWFGRAKVNDLLRLVGPLGTFFLRDVAGKDVILLATGTGIAPVRAMLQSLNTYAPEALPRSVSVFWGARTVGELYWDVADSFPEHRYFPVLSRAPESWAGARGYVQQIMVRECSCLDNASLYACGSEAMIISSRQLLLAAGVSDRRFFADAFVSTSK